MNDLFGQILGWLPMLSRPQVLLQLALVGLVVVGGQLLARRVGRTTRHWALELGATVVMGGLGCGLLAIAQQPVTLALLLIAFVASLQLSELLLRRSTGWLPADQMQPLRYLLIRPFLFGGLVWSLIELLDTRAELALIPLGRWVGATVNVGDLTRLVVALYLLMVSSGPPSLGVAWLLKRVFALERVSVRAMGLMVRYAVITLGTIAVLETIGFNSTAVLAIAGGCRWASALASRRSSAISSAACGCCSRAPCGRATSWPWMAISAKCGAWACGPRGSGATVTMPSW